MLSYIRTYVHFPPVCMLFKIFLNINNVYLYNLSKIGVNIFKGYYFLSLCTFKTAADVGHPNMFKPSVVCG